MKITGSFFTCWSFFCLFLTAFYTYQSIALWEIRTIACTFALNMQTGSRQVDNLDQIRACFYLVLRCRITGVQKRHIMSMRNKNVEDYLDVFETSTSLCCLSLCALPFMSGFFYQQVGSENLKTRNGAGVSHYCKLFWARWKNVSSSVQCNV